MIGNRFQTAHALWKLRAVRGDVSLANSQNRLLHEYEATAVLCFAIEVRS